MKMSNNDNSLNTNNDSDNEKYDCQISSIPQEHLTMFQNITHFSYNLKKMHRDQLLNFLEKKNLCTDGNLVIMRNRLLTHFKMQALIQAKICDNESSYIPYFVIIDIEATCEEDNPPDHKYVVIL